MKGGVFLNSVFLTSRSVTYAQRAERILAKNGIVSNVMKAPFGKNSGACAYAVRINDKNIVKALGIIKESGLSYTDIMIKQADGSYRGLENDIFR